MIAAIPTKYQGVQFRSRLEARWAAMFDLLGWSWEYEPIDLPGWIPDFLLFEKVLIEVKPANRQEDFTETQRKLEGKDAREIIILGASFCPIIRFTSYGDCGVESCGVSSDEWGDRWHGVQICECSCGWTLSTSQGGWYCRRGCPSEGDYRCQPGRAVDVPHDHRVKMLWREAGNRVQWRGVGAMP